MTVSSAAPSPAEGAALDVRHLSVGFGGVRAVDDLSFSVQSGHICGLIGPNGAGKTTVFNCISRLVAAQSGEIDVFGSPIRDQPPERIARAGIGRTFQQVKLFPGMTVRENVMVGAHTTSRAGVVRCGLRLPGFRAEERILHSRATELLELLGLTAEAEHRAGSLPFGTLKRVDIARALAHRPRLLLLDEPAGGLNVAEVRKLADTIRRISALGVTIVLVEHHMGLVMDVSERIVVLEFGRLLAEGGPAEIKADQRVVDAYLGVPA